MKIKKKSQDEDEEGVNRRMKRWEEEG